MLFQDITILDRDLNVREHQYVATAGAKITYIGDVPPSGDHGPICPGQGKLLMPGFYNAHAHTPMSLLRGYGENLPLDRWLHERIFPFENLLTPDAVYWATMLGIAESLRFGIVSNTDMYNFAPDMARAFLETGMKANIGRPVLAFGDEDLADLQGFQEMRDFHREFHGQGDGRLLADVSLHAEYTSTPKVVRQLAEYARALPGARMHVHVSETRAEVEGCKARHGKTPPRYLYDLGLFDVPTTAAHCVALEDGDFDLLAEKGVTVASCPMSNLKLASGICNVQRLMQAGVHVAIGTDSVASNNSLNFLEEIKLFAVLHKGITLDPTLITPREAIQAATQMGAHAQGRMDCGSLQEGYRADLIVLDLNQPNMHPAHNVLNNVVYAASGADVLLTMVDGQVLYEHGEYKTLDIKRVIHEAERATHNILSQL